MQENFVRAKLDEIVVNVELLLVSVVQGFALTTIAESAMEIIDKHQYAYVPYLVAAFFFVLIFWSQSIMHTLSFIKWPPDLLHGFIYFVIALIEFVTFSNIADPKRWFLMTSILALVLLFLYVYDFWLIREKKRATAAGAECNVYDDTEKEQRFGLKAFVPWALLYNAVAFFLICRYHEFFIDRGYHQILIGLQAFTALLYLIQSVWNFRRRIWLIDQVIAEVEE